MPSKDKPQQSYDETELMDFLSKLSATAGTMGSKDGYPISEFIKTFNDDWKKTSLDELAQKFGRRDPEHLLKWDKLASAITVKKGPMRGERRIVAKVTENNRLAMALIDGTRDELERHKQPELRRWQTVGARDRSQSRKLPTLLQSRPSQKVNATYLQLPLLNSSAPPMMTSQHLPMANKRGGLSMIQVAKHPFPQTEQRHPPIRPPSPPPGFEAMLPPCVGSSVKGLKKKKKKRGGGRASPTLSMPPPTLVPLPLIFDRRVSIPDSVPSLRDMRRLNSYTSVHSLANNSTSSRLGDYSTTDSECDDSRDKAKQMLYHAVKERMESSTSASTQPPSSNESGDELVKSCNSTLDGKSLENGWKPKPHYSCVRDIFKDMALTSLCSKESRMKK